MRLVVYTCFIALLAGCHEDDNKTILKPDGLQKHSKYEGILAMCKAITIDTLKVHCNGSMQDTWDTADTCKYIGVELDSTESLLFPPEFAPGPNTNYSGIYVCYAFAIDSNHTGIIARTPFMDQLSSIKLFTLDKVRDTLTSFIELAELWDKAAETSETISWLYRNEKTKLYAYMWIHNTYDHGMENENDTTIDEHDYYYLVDLSKPKYDTISNNDSSLLRTFQLMDRK